MRTPPPLLPLLLPLVIGRIVARWEASPGSLCAAGGRKEKRESAIRASVSYLLGHVQTRRRLWVGQRESTLFFLRRHKKGHRRAPRRCPCRSRLPSPLPRMAGASPPSAAAAAALARRASPASPAASPPHDACGGDDAPPADPDPDPPAGGGAAVLPPLLRARLAKRGILVPTGDEGPPAAGPARPAATGPHLVWRAVPPAALADVAAVPVPPGWGVAFDWGHRLPYFFNPWTGVRTWTHPLASYAGSGDPAPWGRPHQHQHQPAPPLSAPPPPFDPSPVFTGARPGWAFKMGGRGLGYYQDDGGGGESAAGGGRGGGDGGGPANPPPPAPGAGHRGPPGASGPPPPAGTAGGRGGRDPAQPPPPAPPPPPSAIDPMDPSAYSDAPRGGWGSGLGQARKG